MTTYTTDLRFPIMTPGDPGIVNTWGTILNSFIQVLETAVTGASAISLANLSSYSLTTANNAPDEARQAVYNFTGPLGGPCTVTMPQVPKTGFVWNQTTGGQPVILTTGAPGGATLAVQSGSMMVYVCDGANVFGPQLSAPRLPGEMVAYAGWEMPPLWYPCAGQAMSRTTYAALFAALTQAITGTTTAGSTIMSVSAEVGIAAVPCPISGPAIPSGTIVTGETGSPGAWTWTLSQPATATVSSVSFVTAPYGVGDGSTTFNLPDLRSRVPVGIDSMAGNSVNLSPVGALGNQVGSQFLQSHAHGLTDPGHTHGTDDPGHTHGASDSGHNHELPGNTLYGSVTGQYTPANDNQTNFGVQQSYTDIGYADLTVTLAYTGLSVVSAYTGISVQENGAGNGQNMQPSLGVNWIIYAGV